MTRTSCSCPKSRDDAFVEVLVRGEISLYKLRNTYFLQKDSSLATLESRMEKVEKDGRKIYAEQNNWKGTLQLFMIECYSDLAERIERLVFNEKSLTRLVIDYHKCREATYTEFKADKAWTKFRLGVSVDMVASRVRIPGRQPSPHPYMEKSYAAVDPSVGLLLVVSSPRLSERASFHLGVQYLSARYASQIVVDRFITQYYETIIDLRVLSGPLSVRYSFPEKKIGWHLQAGLNYDRHLGSSNQLLYEEVVDNVAETFPARIFFLQRKDQIGYWGGVGIHKSFQGFLASLSLRYVHMPDFGKTHLVDINTNRLCLQLALAMK